MRDQGVSIRSYLLSSERENAQRLILSSLGWTEFPDLRPDLMLVKLCVREEDIVTFEDASGQKVQFLVPASASCHDFEKMHTALIVRRGSLCSEEGAQVGDFVMIPRHEGTEFMWEGVVVRLVPEKCVYGVIQSPRLVHMEEREE